MGKSFHIQKNEAIKNMKEEMKGANMKAQQRKNKGRGEHYSELGGISCYFCH